MRPRWGAVKARLAVGGGGRGGGGGNGLHGDHSRLQDTYRRRHKRHDGAGVEVANRADARVIALVAGGYDGNSD